MLFNQAVVLPMQLIKNGLTIREAKVHMKTQKSSHYDPMHASTLEPYACIKGVKLVKTTITLLFWSSG